jgi:cytidylate kinase
MDTRIRIAIDGPVGSGKSTVAKRVARAMGYTYIDTGAMYRALALKAKRKGISWDDADGMTALARSTSVALEPAGAEDETSVVRLDGEDVSRAIRETEIGGGASRIGTIPGVRRALVEMQRTMATAGGVVMEGRDIGTNVVPDAAVKVYLTARPEVRARRRWKELRAGGADVRLDEVLEDVTARDRRDSERTLAPLRQADDAVVVDSTTATLDEVVAVVEEIARSGLGCSGGSGTS